MKRLLAVLCLFLRLAAQPVTLVCEDSPPFNYLRDEQVVGIAADIIREAFREAGHQVAFRQAPWTQALAMARTGQVDGIFCLYRTPERERSFVFSEPFASDTQAFFVLAELALDYAGDLRRMASQRIGVVRGYSYGAAFDQATRNGTLRRVETASDFTSNLQKLLDHRLDCLVEGEYLGLTRLKELRLQDRIRALPVKVNEPCLHVGFSRKRHGTALAADFNHGLEAIRKNGTYARIIARYTRACEE